MSWCQVDPVCFWGGGGVSADEDPNSPMVIPTARVKMEPNRERGGMADLYFVIARNVVGEYKLICGKVT